MYLLSIQRIQVSSIFFSIGGPGVPLPSCIPPSNPRILEHYIVNEWLKSLRDLVGSQIPCILVRFTSTMFHVPSGQTQIDVVPCSLHTAFAETREMLFAQLVLYKGLSAQVQELLVLSLSLIHI